MCELIFAHMCGAALLPFISQCAAHLTTLTISHRYYLMPRPKRKTSSGNTNSDVSCRVIATSSTHMTILSPRNVIGCSRWNTPPSVTYTNLSRVNYTPDQMGVSRQYNHVTPIDIYFTRDNLFTLHVLRNILKI